MDVDYRVLLGEPMREMERIYGHFGLPLRGETRQAMSEFLARNPQNKHGSHRYSLEEYGLSAGMVAERLRFYLQRFDLPST